MAYWGAVVGGGGRVRGGDDPQCERGQFATDSYATNFCTRKFSGKLKYVFLVLYRSLKKRFVL